MDVWPVSLQQILNTASFQYQLGNTKVKSETAVGPAKVRARTTDAVDTYTCSINIPMSDVATFKTFYKTTLGGGVLPFTFNDPFDGTPSSFRFSPDSDPTIVPLGSGGLEFVLSMAWEKLP